MKLKQKLLGLGLAALLNSCNNDSSFEGKVVDVDGAAYYKIITVENRTAGSVALIIEPNTWHDFLGGRIRNFKMGSQIELEGCNTEIAYTQEDGAKIYVLKDCSFYGEK